jgi:hypothetical protein
MVAFYRQGCVKAVKVALDITVAPDLPVAAAETMRRPRPGKIASLFMNPLEINGNKPYHQNSLKRGFYPETKRAGSSPKLSARFYYDIKKDLQRRSR